MEIVVHKYGGTSVSTVQSREKIVENSKKVIAKKQKLVIIVSAMGRSGAPYATDTLIKMLETIGPDAHPRSMDLLMTCGEIISSVVMSHTLCSHGLDSVALTGHQAGILTTPTPMDANIIDIDTGAILDHLSKDKVVVVAGFQGMDAQGNMTTLGRGGSDTSAAALGEALDAKCVEIYTDVDGIMTADPRLVKDAKVLESITYDEIYQMAVYGAKVVDHNAVAIAKRARKPLVIRNTFSDAQGTLIADEATLFEMNKSSRKLITAVTSHDGVVQVTLGSIEAKEEFLNALDEAHIQMDMINLSEDKNIFSIPKNKVRVLKPILEGLDLPYDLSEEASKLTVVGHKIHRLPGILKSTVMALSKANIEIIQSSDSNTSISFLIDKKNSPRAVKILHTAFDL